MTAPLLVVRADAGPQMGTGHMVRCATLARAFARCGWCTAFATVPRSLDAVPLPPEVECLSLDDPGLGSAGAIIERWPAIDLLVVDHYGLDAAFERRCRKVAGTVLALDDLCDRAHDADYLVNQNTGFAAEDYAGLVPLGRHLLLGPRWALLAEGFEGLRRQAEVRRESFGEVARVLVSFGGTDPVDATSLAIEALVRLNRRLCVDVVLGPAAPALDRVRALCRELEGATLHVGTTQMAELMLAADIAVGAGGSTTWERCCLGLPTVCLPIADNQLRAVHSLAAAGVIRLVEERTTDALTAGIGSLIDSPEDRRRMSRDGMALVDGRGAERLVETLSVREAAS